MYVQHASVSPKGWMEILSSSHPSKHFSPAILSAGSTKTQFHARLSCKVGICMRRRASNPKEAAASEFHVTRTRQHIDLHKWEASWHFHAGHRRHKWMKVCYQSDLEGEKWWLQTIGHPAQKAGARVSIALSTVLWMVRIYRWLQHLCHRTHVAEKSSLTFASSREERDQTPTMLVRVLSPTVIRRKLILRAISRVWIDLRNQSHCVSHVKLHPGSFDPSCVYAEKEISQVDGSKLKALSLSEIFANCIFSSVLGQLATFQESLQYELRTNC